MEFSTQVVARKSLKYLLEPDEFRRSAAFETLKLWKTLLKWVHVSPSPFFPDWNNWSWWRFLAPGCCAPCIPTYFSDEVILGVSFLLLASTCRFFFLPARCPPVNYNYSWLALALHFMTDLFTMLKFHNPSIDVSKLHKVLQSPDFDTIKCARVCRVFLSVPTYAEFIRQALKLL